MSRLALTEAADALARLAAKRQDQGLSIRAWSLARRLDEGRFRFVFVGWQKRGKSTLVNAFLAGLAKVGPTARRFTLKHALRSSARANEST